MNDINAPSLAINVNSLRNRLSFIGRAIVNVSLHPILSALRIEFSVSTLQIASYNLDACIQVELDAENINLPANGPKSYVLCPPAKLLTEILSKLPGEGEVRLSLTEETEHLITIDCGGFVCTIKGFDPCGYPELPLLPTEEASLTRTIPLGEMRSGLEKVIYAVATEETKQILTGVFCEFFTDGLRLTATDGHRIARAANIGLGEKTNMGKLLHSTVFSKSILDLLVAMPGADDVQLYINLDERRAQFQAAKTTASANLIIGQFPNVETILNPTGNCWTTSVRIERVQLLSAVERCQIVANATENRVAILDIKTSKLTINAKSETAQVHEKMSCRLTAGKEQRIGFNSKYLFAALKATRSEIIDLLLNEAKTMGKILPIDDPTHEQLIAQIQIRGGVEEKSVEPESVEPEGEEDESETTEEMLDVLELEHRPTTPAINTYIQFKKQYPDHLVLMRLGDFYEAFGTDAKTLADVTESVLTAKSTAGFRLPMSGLPPHGLERFLPRLTQSGISVAVVDAGAVRLVELTPSEPEDDEVNLDETDQKTYEALTTVPPSDANFKQALKEASIPALEAALDFCRSVPEGNKTRHKQIESQLKKLTK